MKKLILATTILGLFATTSSIHASSNNDFGQDSLDVIHSSVNDNAGKYGNIVYGGDIVVNGKTQYLFFEYEDLHQALENCKDIHKDILLQIEEMYGLDKLSIDNWKLYADKINQYKHDTAILDESGNQTLSNEDDMIELEKFFDIFENKFENDKIKKLVNETRLEKTSVNEEKVALLLPNYSPMAEEFTAGNLETQNNRRKAEDLTRINDQGVNYAIRHATSINHPKYFYFNADCTNFASQILEASGVRQVGGSNEYTGWWHTGSGTSYGHKHSISWINANTFARYMGVGYTTKDHYYFSQNIKKYDFIAYDKASDGSWDHIAYVVADNNYVGNYGYYDYRVAQHTTNYVAWTSSSTNNWEKIGWQGGTYGRVRR